MLFRKAWNTKPVLKKLRSRLAATLVEYVFIVSIISIAGVTFLAAIGQTTHNYLEMVNSNMP